MGTESREPIAAPIAWAFTETPGEKLGCKDGTANWPPDTVIAGVEGSKEPIPEESREAGVSRDIPRATCGAVEGGAGFQTSGQGRPSSSLSTPRTRCCGYGCCSTWRMPSANGGFRRENMEALGSTDCTRQSMRLIHMSSQGPCSQD